MALKLKLDTIDGLDPAVASLYTKAEDGKYHLDAEGLAEIQTALKAANKEAADRRIALDKLKGVDPEKYQALLQAEEERAAKDAESKGQWDKLKEQMAAKHEADIKAKDEQLAKYRTKLEKVLIDGEAVKAIAAAKGEPDLLLPHVKTRVKVMEQDGEFTFQILDKKGNPMVADAAGTPAGFGHLVESMKAEPVFGRAFEGNGASGGGAHQSPANGGSRQFTISRAQAKDATAYQAVRAEAEKAGQTVTITD